MTAQQAKLAEARRRLGKKAVVLVVHDPSFPAYEDEDLGRGTPYGSGAVALWRFARRLGFNGLQLGPGGATTRVNRSPYDATLFSRSPLSIAVAPLLRGPLGGLLSERTAERLTRACRTSGAFVEDRRTWIAIDWILREAEKRLPSHRGASEAYARFVQGARGWLDGDARFEALAARHGTDDPAAWEKWPAELRASADAASHASDRWQIAQFLLHAQHAAFKATVNQDGGRLYGDLQIGFSPRDRWAYADHFLRGYRLGAPPSRTNPAGQPWGIPVLDPGSPQETRSFIKARIDKMLAEYDGVRVDHPHGWVCPWIYRDDEDPLFAVQHGARLFETTRDPRHAALFPFARVRDAQIDHKALPFADERVRDLDEAQIDAYAEWLAVIVDRLRAAGRSDSSIVCEVLSTQPAPLAAVVRRYGLGRFRVTQKANLDDPADVYRSDRAEPPDWIMLGTHDTPPFARLVDTWFASPGEAFACRVRYLSRRLAVPSEQGALADRLRSEPATFVEASFADLFLSDAEHIQIFFPDLFGIRETYNQPGVVNDHNWRLRVPLDFERSHDEALEQHRWGSVVRAMSWALRMRGDRELAAALHS